MSLTVLDAINNTVPFALPSDWSTVIDQWGTNIQLYRDYIDGKHRLQLSQAVADLLMIDKQADERFTVNYSELVMQKLADRIKVMSIKGVNDELTQWVDRLRKQSRFDGLQIDVHEATIAEGDTFVMIDPARLADGKEFPTLINEPSFNGRAGIVPIYDLTQQNIIAIAKIWENPNQKKASGEDEQIMDYRINLYYPDRIEKYITSDGNMEPFPEVKVDDDGNIDNEASHIIPWVHPTKQTPIGIPFVHFKNGDRSGKQFGKSGIKAVIPLNDVLNRATMNMTLIAELTAAMIRYVIGAGAPPAGVTPGMWVAIGEDGIPRDNHFPQVGTFEIGSVTPIVEQCAYVVNEISNITDTPLPGNMGSSAASGESLKQREIGFTARAEKLQTKFGNKWEDVIELAYIIQDAFGTIKPPEGADGWDTIWKPAEVRNDAEIVNNANAISNKIDNRTYLETIAPVYSWDKDQIDIILQRMQDQVAFSNGLQPFPTITPNSLAGLSQTGLDALARTASATEA